MGAGTAATTTCSLKTAWAGAPFPENRVGGAPFPKTAWAGAPIPRNRAARHAVSHVVRSSALHLPRIYLDLKVAWRQQELLLLCGSSCAGAPVRELLCGVPKLYLVELCLRL
jgi:hypothetical protein